MRDIQCHGGLHLKGAKLPNTFQNILIAVQLLQHVQIGGIEDNGTAGLVIQGIHQEGQTGVFCRGGGFGQGRFDLGQGGIGAGAVQVREDAEGFALKVGQLLGRILHKHIHAHIADFCAGGGDAAQGDGNLQQGNQSIEEDGGGHNTQEGAQDEFAPDFGLAGEKKHRQGNQHQQYGRRHNKFEGNQTAHQQHDNHKHRQQPQQGGKNQIHPASPRGGLGFGLGGRLGCRIGD